MPLQSRQPRNSKHLVGNMPRRDTDLIVRPFDSIRPECIRVIAEKKREGTNRILMLSKSGMNDTAVEQNLRGIRDSIELSQGFIVLIIIIMTKGCHPSFDFLLQR